MVINFFCKDKHLSPNQKVGSYTVTGRVGEGRYGICYMAEHKGSSYILKQLKNKMRRLNPEKAMLEGQILAQLSHPGIPKFVETLNFSGFFGYAIEYKTGRTFESIINDDKHIFTQSEIYDIGKQLIQIIKYLHHNNIVHRDIRVPNALYDNGLVYLVDFGLARFVNQEKYTIQSDFFYLADFLLHLYYTTYEPASAQTLAWYDELPISSDKILFLKRLMCLEDSFNNIFDVEKAFDAIIPKLN